MIRTSFNEGWRVRPKAGLFAELSGEPVAFKPVTLPHDAMIERERHPDTPGGPAAAFFPGGVYEYERTFHVPEDYRRKRVTLEFEGVYRQAMVFINGDLAGQCASGYTAFAVKADNFLRYDADNRVRVECRTGEDSRWYSGAGIYRDTHLIVGDLIHVALDGVRVTTPDNDPERAAVEIAVVVENEDLATRNVDVITEVRDGDGNAVASSTAPVTVVPGEPATVRHRLYVRHPALWSVESPALYSAVVVLQDASGVRDEDRVTFGIRRLQLDPDHGLRLNGEPVKLRGACVHHDNGPIGAATITRADERRVHLLKEAGFNALRSSHNPMSRAMLDACDRHGMLVMDEAYDMWTASKSDSDHASDFPQWWEREIESMVRKDFNHPSVVMYSIGNEIPEVGTGLGSLWGRRLAEKIRSLDDTRYITNGVNGLIAVMDEVKAMVAGRMGDTESMGINTFMANVGEAMNQLGSSEVVTERTEESFAVLDIAGMNYLDARYESDRELFPNRIIVGTETFPPHIDVNWGLVRRNGHVLGDFTWTGWDYLGEVGVGRTTHADDPSSRGFMAPYPWLTAWVGDIDITGHRRPASHYREVVFGLRREPYIAVQRPTHHGRQVVSGPWSWTDCVSSWTWDEFEGKPVRVEVYSDAEEVELLVNGDTVGRAPAGEAHRFRAEFDTTYHPGEVVAIAWADGKEQGRHRLVSAKGPVRLAVEADRTEIRADSTDLAFVTIALTDADGTVYTDQDRLVTVDVSGPGTSQGFGSARPETEERFTDDTHTSFDGRALAVIRPTGAGEITVTVSAPDCEPALVAVRAMELEA